MKASDENWIFCKIGKNGKAKAADILILHKYQVNVQWCHSQLGNFG